MTTWKDDFSVLVGAMTDTSVAFLALAPRSIEPEEQTFCQLAWWKDGQWGNNGQVDFVAVSASICTHPIRQAVLIGSQGEAVLSGGGERHGEQIASEAAGPRERGPLRAVRGIAGKAYAVGMGRQVYRRDDRDVWTCIDASMPPATRGEVVGFEAVDGFSAKEIYAVGWEGEIWRYDGGTWRSVKSPSKLILSDVCCAGDGRVYACGQMGTLLTGRRASWRRVDHGGPAEHLWSLAWFKGALYASSHEAIYRLEDGKLTAVDFGDDAPATRHRLVANADVLWSVGADDIFSFDGRAWTKVA